MQAKAKGNVAKSRRKMAAISLALVGAVGLVGCGSDKNNNVTTSETTALANETAAARAAETTSASVETEAETSAETTAETTAGSSDSNAADSAPTDTANAAPADTAPTDTAVTVAALAADSPTCKAFAEVKRLNDETGALTNELQLKIADVVSKTTSGDSSGTESGTKTIETEFAQFIDKFNAASKTSVPKLQAAYVILAKEQPQFKTELEAVEKVTVKAIEFFGTANAKKLDTFSEDLIAALGMETVTEAGTGTLKIDAFSRKACNLTFANS
jgi:hypothetical protein